MNNIKIFENKQIRSTWNAEDEKWYFVIVDVVAVLSDSLNPSDYIKKMRKRDEQLSKGWGQIVTPLMVDTPGGKQKINCADIQSLFRIIQSIPSPKAEPFKQWLAKVGYERVEESENPELSIDRAMQTYLQKGYSKEWINQRLKSIEVRKELTDEWENRGVKREHEFAILTDIITNAWSGKTVKEYKKHKSLKKENLRDHMTNLELVLNMLAEATTTEISKEKKPKNLDENKIIAKQGGTIAGNTRREIESKTGKKIVSNLNAKKLKGTNETEKLR